MKITKKIISPFLGLVLLFLFILPMKAEAKAFGSDCETTTTGGGESCYVTKTVCKRYFLWIRYDTELTDMQIDCSHLQ
ncbi:hypothetical protein C7377_1867 [Balneicella halophila]|uniref:Uncharacterized protein n=2 Tax=Balneicella halophila TaxID=1537566 RepID=A0A7L4UN58_BALHA|nr:hypothetical protein C7377_1867 [Balneicella halophila]